MKPEPIVSAVPELVRCQRPDLRSFKTRAIMHPHFLLLAALRAAGGSFAEQAGEARRDGTADDLIALRRFSRWLRPPHGRGARLARKQRAGWAKLRPCLANCRRSLEIDLLRGAVMDRLRVSLSEVVGLAHLGKETSSAPHLPYTSCLPEKLVCGGSGMSCGVGLAMWGRAACRQ